MIRAKIEVLAQAGKQPLRHTAVEVVHIANAGSAGDGAANYRVWAGSQVEREPDAWVFAHPAAEGATALVGKAIRALEEVGCVGQCVL